MEVVTVKFQEDVLKKIDCAIGKNNFNSRTEFIREAVRDKLSDLERKKLFENFLKLRGSAKQAKSVDDDGEIRERVGREYFAGLEKRFK